MPPSGARPSSAYVGLVSWWERTSEPGIREWSISLPCNSTDKLLRHLEKVARRKSEAGGRGGGGGGEQVISDRALGFLYLEAFYLVSSRQMVWFHFTCTRILAAFAAASPPSPHPHPPPLPAPPLLLPRPPALSSLSDCYFCASFALWCTLWKKLSCHPPERTVAMYRSWGLITELSK